jgi:uncharacterized protein
MTEQPELDALPRRVLAIDGGGIRGVLPASFLATVEDKLGVNVADHFDLIVGTSTGGIIALGLGLGLSAPEILDFYKQHGPRIFKDDFRLRFLRHLFRSKYNNTALKEALESVFGDARLGQSKVRLTIPSLNLETGSVHIFKTAHHTRFLSDYTELATTVALATAAAPTYFPTYRSPSEVRLIDGGLFANNPVGLSAVEALGILEWTKGHVEVLSLGCGTEPVPRGAVKRRRAGLTGWVPYLMSATLKAQSSYSIGTAQLLLGHDHVLRIDPEVAPGRFKLDRAKQIDDLAGLGATEARTAMDKVRSQFFNRPAEPFLPIYQL